MKQQDLVWLQFPFSNLKDRKIRPAVVVSNNEYNKEGNDLLVCAVTSNPDAKKYSVPLNQGNLSSGDLPISSRVRADKLFQVEKKLVLKCFAKIDDKTFDSISNEIKNLTARK